LCDRRGLVLIEDAAHHPALAPVGEATCLSFFTNKVLACGEGGLVATNDAAMAEHVRLHRAQGLTSDTWSRHHAASGGYDVTAFGFNYRFDDLRAALLASRLDRLEDEIVVRRSLVRRYRELLADVVGVTVPYTDAQVDDSACYVMPVLLEDAATRNRSRAALSEDHGVQTSVLYPALHRLSVWPEGDTHRALPHAEAVGARQLTLPLYAHMGRESVDRVVEALTAVSVAARN